MIHIIKGVLNILTTMSVMVLGAIIGSMAGGIIGAVLGVIFAPLALYMLIFEPKK